MRIRKQYSKKREINAQSQTLQRLAGRNERRLKAKKKQTYASYFILDRNCHILPPAFFLPNENSSFNLTHL